MFQKLHTPYTENPFLKLEKETQNNLMSTLYTNEPSTKITKYEFTNPLQRHQNITSACGIQFSIKAYVIHRENRFLKLEKETKNTLISASYSNEGSL